jgi:hypothetical protein
MTDFDPTIRTDLSRTRDDLCACGMDDDRWGHGHSLSFMQRRLAGATSTKWRDSIVTAVAPSGLITVRAVDDGTELVLWNHSDQTELVTPGQPVAVHSIYHVLALGSHWLSVADLTD